MEMVHKRQEMLRKQGKKGFTLVELIVVIVILGILAAIAIPALVGYIQRAQEQGAIVEGSTARTAIQSIISDASGHPTGVADQFSYTYGATQVLITIPTGGGPVVVDPVEMLKAVNNLTGVNYTALGSITVDTNSIVDGFTIHVPGANRTVTLVGNAYTIV